MTYPSTSGTGCLTCETSNKKCDQSRPTCRRCSRAGIECGGYSSLRNHGRRGSGTKTTRNLSSSIPTGTTIHIADIPITPSGASPPFLRPQACEAELPSQLVSPMSPSNQPHVGPSPEDTVTAELAPSNAPHVPLSFDWSDLEPSFIDCSDFQSGKISIVSSQQLARRVPAPPEEVSRVDVSPPGLPTPSRSRTLKPMTPGQASLFNALFSLAQPEYERTGVSKTTVHASQNPVEMFPSRQSEQDVVWPLVNNNVDDPADTENVSGIICKTIALDRNVRSNSVPFILQCYALWMRRFLFEPLRVVEVARDYVSFRFEISTESRQNMMMISNIVRAVTRSTAYDLEDPPNFGTLVGQMSRGLALANSHREPSRELDMQSAQRALDNSYELISMMCKLSSLSDVLKIMQAAAPVFRRACPDPPEKLVHLPSLLTNIDTNLQYFATLDILLSTITNRPMFFRYDVTFTPKVPESLLSLDDGPGLRWLYGVPDRLLVTLARMNSLFEDFGGCLDTKVIKELEIEIGSFKPIITVSVDPSLTVGRLVVQECWRQAALIYLYMGLCGSDSQDARVLAAQGRFMNLFRWAAPGRNPDSFLVLPMTILGVATWDPEEQTLLRRRVLSLPECVRRGTIGNQIVQMLDVIWSRTSNVGRPAMWSDLRLACLWVTGM